MQWKNRPSVDHDSLRMLIALQWADHSVVVDGRFRALQLGSWTLQDEGISLFFLKILLWGHGGSAAFVPVYVYFVCLTKLILSLFLFFNKKGQRTCKLMSRIKMFYLARLVGWDQHDLQEMPVRGFLGMHQRIDPFQVWPPSTHTKLVGNRKPSYRPRLETGRRPGLAPKFPADHHYMYH